MPVTITSTTKDMFSDPAPGPSEIKTVTNILQVENPEHNVVEVQGK